MAMAALAAVIVAGGCGKTAGKAAGTGPTSGKAAHSAHGGPKGHPGDATPRATNNSPLSANGPQINVKLPTTTRPPVIRHRAVRRGRRR
jgi:hypothetical protein